MRSGDSAQRRLFVQTLNSDLFILIIENIYIYKQKNKFSNDYCFRGGLWLFFWTEGACFLKGCETTFLSLCWFFKRHVEVLAFIEFLLYWSIFKQGVDGRRDEEESKLCG